MPDPGRRRLWVGGLLTALVAALVAPVQAAAGAAVAAALTGGPVVVWCVALGLVTMLRVLGHVGATAVMARGLAEWGHVVALRFHPALLDDPRGEPQDLEAVRTSLGTALRGAAEMAGLHLAAVSILVMADPRLVLGWVTAVVVASLWLSRRCPGAVILAGRSPSAGPGEVLSRDEVTARSLGCDATLRRDDALVVADRIARKRRWSRRSWADGFGPSMIMAQAQAGCAVAAVAQVASGTMPPGLAVAVILVTTTAAARAEGAPAVLRAWQAHRAALGRLRRLRTQPVGVSPSRGPSSVTIGGYGSVAAGGRWVVTGSPLELADIREALAGRGGRSVLLGDGQVRPGTVAWDAMVTVIERAPKLATGPLRRHIDPSLVHAPEVVESILRELALEHLLGRLDEPLGFGGSKLSGGEARRVALAMALVSQSSVLVVEEPDRGLDDASIRAVQEALARRAGTMTVIELRTEAGVLNAVRSA